MWAKTTMRGRGLMAAVVTVMALGFATTSGEAALLEKLSDYAFVASKKSKDVAILSTKEDQVVGKLSLEAVPSQIVVSENQRTLISIHGSSDQVSLVDLDSRDIISMIDLGFRPDRLQIDDDAGLIAISGAEAGLVAMVSLTQQMLLFVTDAVARPSDLMFNRKGRWLYVAEGNAGALTILDPANGRVIKRLVLEASEDTVVELIRTPGGRTGLALHGESGLISALDLDQGTQAGATILPGPAFRGFPSANSQYFLIPNGNQGSMSLVSSWTYRESMNLPAPKTVTGINHAMFDTLAVALGQTTPSLALSLIEDDPKPTSISLPGRPETGLTVDAGKKVYVTLSDTHKVAVIDAQNLKLAGLIDDIGEEPWAITAAGGLGYCH